MRAFCFGENLILVSDKYMSIDALHKILNYLIAAVWIANGLFCKVLNLVPRHQQIVGRILGEEYAFAFTKLIGVSEILMAVWILSGFRKRLNAIAQMLIIAAMNTIEFIVVPDILLWGRLNSLFAFLFILLIGSNEFVLNKPKLQRT
ncbi:MAG: hypothetical protein K0S33_3392 [Bacteroidetes bacterium]|jgi:hypothetical protein|nr:hypothetical protein [Bacteroidota bacterium]